MSAVNEKQVGGTHYKEDDETRIIAELLGYNKPCEHWDFVTMRQYNYLQGNASKYLDRYEKKGTPIQDLEKAKHYIEKLIEIEKAKAGIVEEEAPAEEVEQEQEPEPAPVAAPTFMRRGRGKLK